MQTPTGQRKKTDQRNHVTFTKDTTQAFYIHTYISFAPRRGKKYILYLLTARTLLAYILSQYDCRMCGIVRLQGCNVRNDDPEFYHTLCVLFFVLLFWLWHCPRSVYCCIAAGILKGKLKTKAAGGIACGFFLWVKATANAHG